MDIDVIPDLASILYVTDYAVFFSFGHWGTRLLERKFEDV